ncbi:MAG: translation initiation factor IF-3 [Bacteroidales bacterium]|nr:translation initiation factor IF-3 [Bacteroidales bacterium]MBQ1679766.1 translation initiation factor IF-3 [Bacteroidales bacterium]MBQ1753714.1 translation initiation factor IF-3 [Bacteroidales bacterium]MBQ1831353.1 translation initiation factor IF-3 [Bacteroidales bacterium]MBQ2148830.1 translation initiation factor IF-3 [Bacteroidales bacterium]
MATNYRPPKPRPQAPRKPDPRLPQNRKDKDDGLRINEAITAPRVRLVGDNVPEQGIYPLSQALKLAQERELDLVEIAPTAEPPVCKILDYQKYVYQQKKKAKEQKSNASKVVIKEIRFGPQTDEHDYQFKLNHAKSFLQEGSKVKAYVFFRGRSILFSEQGEKLLLRFALELEEYGKAEQMPKLEGKRMIMMIAPVKKK